MTILVFHLDGSATVIGDDGASLTVGATGQAAQDAALSAFQAIHSPPVAPSATILTLPASDPKVLNALFFSGTNLMVSFGPSGTAVQVGAVVVGGTALGVPH
jgi:hypothetical protein